MKCSTWSEPVRVGTWNIYSSLEGLFVFQDIYCIFEEWQLYSNTLGFYFILSFCVSSLYYLLYWSLTGYLSSSIGLSHFVTHYQRWWGVAVNLEAAGSLAPWFTVSDGALPDRGGPMIIWSRAPESWRLPATYRLDGYLAIPATWSPPKMSLWNPIF